MELIPIEKTMAENASFASNPACEDTLSQCIQFYEIVGFQKPWICYYAREKGEIVGQAAFKGAPRDGTVEIAYGTVNEFRDKGIGTRICESLVEMALTSDPEIRITARTLPEQNHSTRILERNGFRCIGTVDDPNDGDVWEWEYGM